MFVNCHLKNSPCIVQTIYCVCFHPCCLDMWPCPGDPLRNVVMWMDHRAEDQASRITNSNHEVLSRVGGVMSPEMQPPKLLWLKEVRGERGQHRTTNPPDLCFICSRVSMHWFWSGLTLFTMCVHSWNSDWWPIQDIIKHNSAGWVVVSESQGKLLEQSCSLFRPSRLPVVESNWLFNTVSEAMCDSHCILASCPRNVYLIKVNQINSISCSDLFKLFIYLFFLKPNRSLCTLVCKWTYCPPEGWDSSFWSNIGLEDLLENNFSKIGEIKLSNKPLTNVH